VGWRRTSHELPINFKKQLIQQVLASAGGVLALTVFLKNLSSKKMAGVFPAMMRV
jgi:hypothetical protein